ncbi:MAG TPA: hypothetical protein VHK67_02840 [Rhabdochlamydiaceae bacterium]|nr:hypothetical protein [Rhabdochlamydiaceae bacterium]
MLHEERTQLINENEEVLEDFVYSLNKDVGKMRNIFTSVIITGFLLFGLYTLNNHRIQIVKQ